jgi:hypothetical protein
MTNATVRADDSIETSEPDEAIELIEETGTPTAISKPRRGVLWGAL